MTDQDDAAVSAGRLEQALERIATLAARQAAPEPASPDGATPDAVAPATAELAARLDSLIARLRSVIGPEGSA